MAVAAGLAIAHFRYTYPVLERTSAVGTVVALERRWWTGVSLISFDLNTNGAVDIKVMVPGASGNFHTHQVPMEFWEDRNENGQFEAHGVFMESVLDTLELDLNDDGKVDEILRGEVARVRWEGLQLAAREAAEASSRI